jgi:telomerase reverse transcriptase
MLGGRRARAALRRFLMRLVALRRFEKCTLHEALRNVREEEFPWLFGASRVSKARGALRGNRGGPATASLARRRLLRRWVLFLVAELAVPLLRAHFYCTETETHRLRVFYYRKGVWARLTASHLAAMTEDANGETKTPKPKCLRTRLVDPEAGSAFFSSSRVEVNPAAAASAKTASYARLPQKAARVALEHHLLGFSRLRLLPKARGLRPVAMLGRPAVARFPAARAGGRFRGPHARDSRDVYAFRPVNAGLRDVFDVLRFESRKNASEAMGANVADYHDVHARIAPFLRTWRARQRRLVSALGDAETTRGGADADADADAFRKESRIWTRKQSFPVHPRRRCARGPERVAEPPFIVAADVKGAFDSIPLAALERVASALVAAPAYDVRRVTRVTGGGKMGIRAKTTREASEVSRDPVGGGIAADGFVPLGRELGGAHARSPDPAATFASGGGVAIDLAAPSRVHRARVLELLHEHLRKNVVRSGGAYLLQKVGIPQGSVLSALLCGVFYAHLESAHGLREGGCPAAAAGEAAGVCPATVRNEHGSGVLCRWTDDLLFLSSSREPAERFLRKASAGFAGYGCVLNPEKTSLNFVVASDETPATVVERRESLLGGGARRRSAAHVAWCGLLFDSRNCEVTADYSRYAGDFMREAVSVPGRTGSGTSVGVPFAALGRRVVSYLRPKCISLLYDFSINSPLTVHVNVYQNFLIAAVKTHCYAAAASGPALRNAAFFAGTGWRFGSTPPPTGHTGAKTRARLGHRLKRRLK